MSPLDDNAISELIESHPELVGKKIGYVFFNLPTNSMRAQMCEHLTYRAGKYDLIFYSTDYPTESHHEFNIIKEATERHDISGFIIWPSTNFDQYAGKYLEEKNIPFILMPHVSDIFQGKYNEVCTPPDATSLAIEHLVEGGAKNIGFIIGEKTYNTVYVQQRYMCYRNILLENNLNVYEPICIPDHTNEESFYAYNESIINQVKKLDGVFAATDFLMCILYRRCIEAGIKVPDDLLITSIDNTPMAQCLGVTSIEQNFPKIAQKAVDLLVSLLLDPTQKPSQIIIPSELIVRSSSIAPK